MSGHKDFQVKVYIPRTVRRGRGNGKIVGPSVRDILIRAEDIFEARRGALEGLPPGSEVVSAVIAETAFEKNKAREKAVRFWSGA